MRESRHLHSLKKISPFIFNNRKNAFALIFTKFITMLIALIPPVIYQYYINQVITDGNLQKMLYVVLGYLLIFACQSVLLIITRYVEMKYTNSIRIDLKRRILNIYAKMPYVDYEKKNIGEMGLCVESDTDVICSFYLDHCLNYIFAILYAAITIAILFFMNWYLILFGCAMIVLSYFITNVLAKKIERTSEKYRTDQSDFDTFVHDTLHNWKEIKLNDLEDKEVGMISEKWFVLAKSILKSARYNFLHGALIAFNLFFITRMNLYFFGGLLIIYDLMTVPTMLVFMNYYELLYSNIQIVLNSTVNLSSELPKIDRVFSMLEYEKVDKNMKNDISVTALQGDIRFADVSFKYRHSNKDVLNSISATIQQNHSLALVGKSGSGKTTMVKLLVGLYQPTGGEIYFGNKDVREIPEAIKCHFINIVMQDPQLFNMSIMDNLLMAKPDAKKEEIDTVCKSANIFDFIQSIPEKYNTLVGENGIKLSGGQKQRLAIARTLLLNPKVLIFDEATSALDSESESMIGQSIQNLSKYMTIITISHKFSTISNSDDVIIIQDGRIIEQGTMDRILNESDPLTAVYSNEAIKNNNVGV